MRDLRRVSVIGIVLVVFLRIAMGWQLLYEGLWKYDQLDTPRPWTSEGYLKNAQGPFRDHFRGMTQDPDDLNWLDYDWVANRWDDWKGRFTTFYGLNEDQQKQLRLLVDGPKVHGVRLAGVPEGVKLPSFIKFDAERKILIAEADMPLKDSERDAVLRSIPADSKLGSSFRKAFEGLAKKTQSLSYKRRLRGMMLGDPERSGATAFQRKNSLVYEPRMGTVVDSDVSTSLLKYGDVQRYKDMLSRYEQELAEASTDYEFDHLSKEGQQIQQLRGKLVNPIRGIEQELLTDGWEMLSDEQLALGRLVDHDDPIHQLNSMTMWSLIILGTLLIVGLFTPLAALAAAGMIFMFYLPMPPWPGVPPAPGPEHSFIVNKNLIEVIALLGIAALPTGRWFGLDAIVSKLFGRKKRNG